MCETVLINYSLFTVRYCTSNLEQSVYFSNTVYCIVSMVILFISQYSLLFDPILPSVEFIFYHQRITEVHSRLLRLLSTAITHFKCSQIIPWGCSSQCYSLPKKRFSGANTNSSKNVEQQIPTGISAVNDKQLNSIVADPKMLINPEGVIQE